MTGRTHDVAAATALMAVISVVPPTQLTLATALVAVLANQIGGVAPDIDQPTAPLWRNLPVGGLFGKLFGQLVGGHRFLSHSLLGLGLFSVAARMLLAVLAPIMPQVNTQLVWYAFIIGMVSHLIMDTLTREGVPWLLPIPVKFGLPPLRQLRIVTGGKLERLVIFPGLFVGLIWLTSLHYQWLLQLLRSSS